MAHEAKEQTLGAHLEALRQTLIRVLCVIGVGCFGCFVFYKPLIHLLTIPFTALTGATSLIILGPTQGFQTVLKLSFWIGATVTAPVWIWLILQFIQPALNGRERRMILPFLCSSLVLMPLGILFAYFVTIPFANGYLFSFNDSIGENLWSFAEYMEYTILLLLANTLAFELAAIFFVLIHTGGISADWLRRRRRAMVVAIFVLSAVLTPPDVLTQLFLAFPLIALYELLTLYASRRGVLRKSFFYVSESESEFRCEPLSD